MVDRTHTITAWQRTVSPGAIPHLSPLIVAKEHVFFAVEDEKFFRVRAGFYIRSKAVAEITKMYFDSLWNDREASRIIRGPRGMDDDAVAEIWQSLHGQG